MNKNYSDHSPAKQLFYAKQNGEFCVDAKREPSKNDKIHALLDAIIKHQEDHPGEPFHIDVKVVPDPLIDYAQIRCMSDKELDRLLRDCYEDGYHAKTFMYSAKHLVLNGDLTI